MTEGRDPDGQWPTPRGGITRARTVAAAADLFARRGAAATSLEDVRRAAGVSGPQITHYFGGKQGLVRAVLRWEASMSIESLARCGPAGPQTPAFRSW